MQYETARIAYEAQGKHATASGVAVSSSLSGYIKNRLVSQGEYVSVGQPIVTVTKNRRLQLRADVPMENINLLSQISGANFQMVGSKNVYSTEALHGRVLSYARSVSDGSAFLPITLEFDNVGDLVSGAFAMVWLQGKEREGVLLFKRLFKGEKYAPVIGKQLSAQNGVFHAGDVIRNNGLVKRDLKRVFALCLAVACAKLCAALVEMQNSRFKRRKRKPDCIAE